MAHGTDTIEEELRIPSIKVDNDMAQPREPDPLSSPLVERNRKPLPRWGLAAVGLIAAVTLLSWWLYARRFESTDDAQIDGHLNAISARIPGTVMRINPSVENNQYVEAGTLLVELDPNDYQAALDHAKGELADREATSRSSSVNV